MCLFSASFGNLDKPSQTVAPTHPKGKPNNARAQEDEQRADAPPFGKEDGNADSSDDDAAENERGAERNRDSH